MPNFLEGLASEDLGVFLNGQDFIAVQNMRERFRQEIQYRRSFGVSHPNIRLKRPADENSVSFSFLLLKSGVQRGLNSYTVLRAMEDFECQTRKGALIETYVGCNWTDLDIDSSHEQVMVNVDISMPGFFNE